VIFGLLSKALYGLALTIVVCLSSYLEQY